MSGRRASITVLVPARDEAATIAPIVRDLVALRDDGLVDQVLVAEHDSTRRHRRGGRAARRRGRSHGRGLPGARAGRREGRQPVARPDGRPGRHRLLRGRRLGRLRPPLRPPAGRAAAERPAASSTSRASTGGRGATASERQPTGGGRVTTLLARPLLRRFYPELAWLEQPLAGEMAARRSLFEAVPFTTGYGLEIGLLIDIYRKVGAAAISAGRSALATEPPPAARGARPDVRRDPRERDRAAGRGGPPHGSRGAARASARRSPGCAPQRERKGPRPLRVARRDLGARARGAPPPRGARAADGRRGARRAPARRRAG